MVLVEDMQEKHYYLVNGIRRKLVAIKPNHLWFEGIRTSLLKPGEILSGYESPEIIPKTENPDYEEVFSRGGKRKSRRNQRSKKTRKNHRKTNRRR